MSKNVWLSSVAAACFAIAACAATPASAADSNADSASVAISPQTEAVAAAGMAHALAKYGEKTKDPVALLAAARILQAIGGVPLTTPVEREGLATSTPEKPAVAFDSAASAMKAARNLAKGQAPLLAMIDDTEKSGSRKAFNGSIDRHDIVFLVRSDTVRSNGTDVYNIPLIAREPWRVSLSGDGDETLLLLVYDENGHEICRDIDNKVFSASCSVTPKWAGIYKVKIQNTGPTPVRYVIHF
ncbi:hypothetical protein A6A04_19405 [Paramagnetospirillum marisnigri]|uniref:Peptidase C-terminal archaeal/bacterial domain-containing protein n=1 Tax=Paramagnetospirillum marisnigri TaxID=1285242 RepID=A0A178ML51_9PROT|nr:hypothetical protein [Paramagnetospirillum marisnigri]OAN49451.1 hypothetical protein A6A04_19405 [Paramagnetospirillum marisnigri]